MNRSLYANSFDNNFYVSTISYCLYFRCKCTSPIGEDEFGDKEENENDQQWVIFDNKQDTQEPLVSLEHDR